MKSACPARDGTSGGFRGGELTVAYADEFNDLESSAGQFKSISLKGFLVGALSKISRSLINNSNFPIVDYVIGKIAEKFALWTDKELIKGTTDKIEGLSGITQVVTTAASTVITADELIDAQDMVPDVFQPNCVWIMSKRRALLSASSRTARATTCSTRTLPPSGVTLCSADLCTFLTRWTALRRAIPLSTTAISPDFFYQAFQCVLRTQCRKRIKTADLIKRI